MYRKILVTLDGSPLARAALPQIVTLASGTDASVSVLEVVETFETFRRQAEGHYEFTDGEPARIDALAKEWHFSRRDRAMDDVEHGKQELEAAGIKGVQTAVVEGLAGNEIVDFAQREGCDAIVMGARGHGGLGREIVGSVAEYVLRHAGQLAVILVGPRARAA
jgi:nucleotide-binding universal stress UspA family protein